MKFAEKLDLIMNITKTNNSTLARCSALDASHISRLRRGQRQLPPRENYVEAMAEFFAKRCMTDNNRELLKHVLGLEELPRDQSRIAGLIQCWLTQENGSSKKVAAFFGHMAQMDFKSEPPRPINAAELSLLPAGGITVYYGAEGKREAVIAFLSQIISETQPQTLYLCSDEDTGWQFGDKEFIKKWAHLMTEVIRRGNRIKIIHTVSRDLDDMLTAIREWMPLHITGAIDSFYYPRKRDGVFRRTLFIAPLSAALISTSVGSMSDKAANFLIRDRAAIAAVKEEFDNYLAFCRPLMHIYTAANKDGYADTLAEFEKEAADIMISTDSLSILTMPESVAEQAVLRSASLSAAKSLLVFESRVRHFRKQLESNRYTEIIRLPDMNSIINGRVRLDFPDFPCNRDLFYTVEEYTRHLENLVYLLRQYDNFNICISRENKAVGYLTYVKEEVGVMVAKTTAPKVILALNESNLTAAFWDYLNTSINNALTGKAQTISRLVAVINKLKPGHRAL